VQDKSKKDVFVQDENKEDPSSDQAVHPKRMFHPDAAFVREYCSGG
jgi:hypothetical protein